jgi:chorismate mutase
MDIKKLRKEIDRIDSKMIPLLGRREKIVEKIAAIKVKEGIPTKQPKREKEIIARTKKIARKHKLKPSIIDNVYAKIIFPYGYKLHKNARSKKNN